MAKKAIQILLPDVYSLSFLPHSLWPENRTLMRCGFSGKTLEDITDETKDISGQLALTRFCSF